MIKTLAVAMLATLGLAAPASATVTFTGLATPGSCSFAGAYTSDGFDFVSAQSHFHVCGAGIAQTDNGTETLLSDTQTFTMTKVGGGLFDLFSFDAAEWYSYGMSPTISVVGTYANNTTTSATFTLDDLVANGGFQTFTLANSFRNLASVSFSETVLNMAQYDNFVTDAPAGVPEPAALALLGLGVAGIATRRRKPA